MNGLLSFTSAARRRTRAFTIAVVAMLAVLFSLAGPALAYTGTVYNAGGGTGYKIFAIMANGDWKTLAVGDITGGATKVYSQTQSYRVKKNGSIGSVCYRAGYTYPLVTTSQVWTVANC